LTGENKSVERPLGGNQKDKRKKKKKGKKRGKKKRKEEKEKKRRKKNGLEARKVPVYPFDLKEGVKAGSK